MTQPPNDPAPGEQPEEQPWHDPGGPERPPAGQPGGPPPPHAQPPHGGGQEGQQPPYGGQQQPPYGGQSQPPYGQEQPPYGGQGHQPHGGQGQQPPPHPGPYGGHGQQPYGGLPGYSGGAGDYVDPAAGLASRWARLGAAIVDGIIIGIVCGLLSLPFVDWGRVFNPHEGDTYYFNQGQYTSNLIGIVIGFLYYWLMTAKWGQTLGKMLLRIRVVREEDAGAISGGQAVARAAFYTVLGGICGCIGLIDVAWILWDRRKQALHDKVAHTVVVKAGPEVPNPYDGR
ncbi:MULTISPECIES: RDD family protein [Thermomonosporaceae]|uniref:RDD family protein n=1 Tax=Thermomonosporaceae TaxID=2012 RepID=UPI00255ADBDF|nr:MULTISPECIES: RDD family protein [Thermomonosporaceae]MDL4772283.1 RDD family protein [Actinomadura xylanilytica]